MTVPRVFFAAFVVGAALLLVGILALCGAAGARAMFPAGAVCAMSPNR
jgi:hypothetical protein